MTAASLDPSEDDAIEFQYLLGADVSVHDAPESVLLQMPPPVMTAASLYPSEDDAIELHDAWGAGASVHDAPSALIQMRPKMLLEFDRDVAASLHVATVVTADAVLHALPSTPLLAIA